ncbi:MAG: Piwi domain protein [Bacteroidetes bacterium GWA2_32_17]|nr:MAG: Piwi domain protein [Bacteroidetes bacterium GWA2_32_17]
MQLNYFPINIEFENYQINAEPYSEERLAELRKLYNSTHSFFRNGDSIYISNKDGDENISIGTLTEQSTYDNYEITSSLIKHLFFRTFKNRFSDYTPVDFYPFRFFSGQAKDDIIYNALPNNLQNHIAYKKLIELQLRYTQIGGKKQFGFLINIKRNWIFDKSCADLYSEGYNLIGIEVLHAETLPGLTNILAPNEEFIGVIQEVIGSKAKVDTNDGTKEFELGELFIRKTKFNIGNYLTFATSQQKSDEILNIIESKRSDIYNAKNLYSEILNIAKHLFLENSLPVLFQNKDSFCFTVDSKPITVSNTIELKTPTFIFDYAGTKTHNSNPDTGLTNYGPYDSINFDIKTPNVLCICNRANRGYFSNFLSSLKEGVPQSKYFQKGLLKKYDLLDIVFDIKEIQSYNIEEYLSVIKDYDENKPNLAIIEIPTEFRKLDDISNPYFRIKAKLLSLEIPVQYVTSEKIKNHNEYILNSIALQIYAKMGGTPWVLPSHRSVDKEIIIGIGHSWLRKNQYKGAEQNRVVGITTFLSSDGQYLLGDKVKDVSFENYFAELLKSLKQSIQRLSSEQGWVEGDTIRLIFHIFKPIKNTEFDVISQLIKEITEYKIKFAFVTISKFHPNVLFDINQTGVTKYGSTTVKGEFIPNRASNVFLDSETCIVQMFGANELKTAKQGMSTPIQIKIRTPQGKYNNNELNDLLYYDLSYITQQIFSFTYLSWRSFLPGEQPATMLYSNLISKLLSKMRNVTGWDADNLNYGLKRKKWFL